MNIVMINGTLNHKLYNVDITYSFFFFFFLLDDINLSGLSYPKVRPVEERSWYYSTYICGGGGGVRGFIVFPKLLVQTEHSSTSGVRTRLLRCCNPAL